MRAQAMERGVHLADGADETLFAELIGTVYGAVADASLWPHCAEALAKYLGGHSGHISLLHGPQNAIHRLGATTNYTPVRMADYQAYYRFVDIWLEHVARLAPGLVYTSHRILPDAEVLKTEIWNDWCKPMDCFYVLGVLMPSGYRDDQTLIAVHRARTIGPFEEEQRRKLTRLMPHVRQAMQLYARLHELKLVNAASYGILQGLEIGAIIVDAQRRIRYANQVAEDFIQKGCDLLLHNRHAHLSAPDQDQRLAAAIAGAIAIARGRTTACTETVFAIHRHDGGFLSLRVYPLTESLFPGEPHEPSALLLMCPRSTKPAFTRDVLRALYRLSPAEAALAEALVRGETVKAFANRTRHSIATVRTQVQQILGKTGHRRQSDFLREASANLIARLNLPGDAPAGHTTTR